MKTEVIRSACCDVAVLAGHEWMLMESYFWLYIFVHFLFGAQQFIYRLASKTTGSDEPGAFAAREWLRKLVVGKPVRFETRKQGASAGDRVYGWLFLDQQPGSGGGGADPIHLAVECVRQGHATPKAVKFPGKVAADDAAAGGEEPDENDYETQLLKAYKEAEEAKREAARVAEFDRARRHL